MKLAQKLMSSTALATVMGFAGTGCSLFQRSEYIDDPARGGEAIVYPSTLGNRGENDTTIINYFADGDEVLNSVIFLLVSDAYSDLRGFNQEKEVRGLEAVFGAIEEVTNIKFNRVYSFSEADLHVFSVDILDAKVGETNYVVGRTHIGQFGRGTAIYLDEDIFADEEITRGSLRFSLLMHEVLHALGFKHPFKQGQTGVFLSSDLMSKANSNMTYILPKTFILEDGQVIETGYFCTPGIFDIEELWKKYGANPALLAENGKETNLDVCPDGRQVLFNRNGSDTLVTESYTAFLDLRGGQNYPSHVDGKKFFWISYDSCYVNAVSAGGRLIGSEGDNELRITGCEENAVMVGMYRPEPTSRIVAGGGNDVLQSAVTTEMIGGEGRDIFVIGEGYNTAKDFRPESDFLRLTEIVGECIFSASGGDTVIHFNDRNGQRLPAEMVLEGVDIARYAEIKILPPVANEGRGPGTEAQKARLVQSAAQLQTQR